MRKVGFVFNSTGISGQMRGNGVGLYIVETEISSEKDRAGPQFLHKRVERP